MRSITNFVRKLYGQAPLVVDLETWAQRNAELTTPDDLIEAAIVQSFAAEFGDWETPNLSNLSHSYYYEDSIACLRNAKKGLDLKFKVGRTGHGLSYDYFVEKCYINDMLLPKEACNRLYTSWSTISAKVEAAEAAAAKAKADMEANERKWNLAEKLLGMKRNEHGALVPVVESS